MGLLLKLLGGIDLLSALVLFLAPFHLFPTKWVLFLATLLIMKSLAFYDKVVSVLDFVVALVIIATPLFTAPLLTTLFGLYIVIKALYSFV